MSDIKITHETLWKQFPEGPKSGGPGFLLAVERAYEGDRGILVLRDLGAPGHGSLVADNAAKRLAETIDTFLAGRV